MRRITAFKTLCLAAAFSCVTLTAAYAQQATPQGDDTEIALLRPAFLQLEITVSCIETGAVFKVINHGPKWPQRSVLRLYRAASKSMVTERSLRLGEGQKASFMVKSKTMMGERFALWIDPTWYKREMKYDASISCS